MRKFLFLLLFVLSLPVIAQRYPGSGITSLNGETGAVTIVGGTNITVTPSGQNITISASGGSGTVTSVGLSDGSSTPIFSISNSPVTSSGTLTETLLTQGANTVLAGPTTGSAAQPTFRALVSADIPNNAANTSGTAANITATTNSTLTTLSALSLPGSQVSGDISGNAANITATSNSTLTTLSALSLPYSQITGAPAAGITQLTGDGTAGPGSGSQALTLATVNTNTGSFGSSSAIPAFTVNGKGLITAASTNAVVAPAGTLTGTTLASNVVTSSLTSVGTIGTGTWSGTTIAVANGGTGQTSYTNGQLLIGNTTGNTLAKATLTAGSNINITNGAGSITIAATGAAPAYSYVSQNSTLNPAVIGTYYILSGASFTITLPTAASIAGQSLVFQHNGTSLSQKYTFNTTSSQTINGPGGTVASGNYIMTTNGETLVLTSDGANWQVSQHGTNTGWVSDNTATVQFATFTISSHTSAIGSTYTTNGGSTTCTTAVGETTSTTVIMSCNGAITASPSTLTYVSGSTTGNLSYTAFTCTNGSTTTCANNVSATTTPPIFYGSPTTNSILWRRTGNIMTLWFNFYQSVAGTAAGSGDYIFPLPTGTLINTTVIPAFTGGSAGSGQGEIPSVMTSLVPLASGWGADSTSSAYNSIGMWAPYSTSQYRIYGSQGFTTTVMVSMGNATIAATHVINYNWKIDVPISDWQP